MSMEKTGSLQIYTLVPPYPWIYNYPLAKCYLKLLNGNSGNEQLLCLELQAILSSIKKSSASYCLTQSMNRPFVLDVHSAL